MGLDPSTFPSFATGGNFQPSTMEAALVRIAPALERLVALQSEAQQAPDVAEAIVEWLSTLDHADLDQAVMTRRQGLGEPVMWTVLEVLKEWASGDRP